MPSKPDAGRDSMIENTYALYIRYELRESLFHMALEAPNSLLCQFLTDLAVGSTSEGPSLSLSTGPQILIRLARVKYRRRGRSCPLTMG
jgi:hypothetical protein